ncbi:CPBP family intramembrane glutamic endopeptidase [Candidatus Oscillochloris fontis]|uniref:CPBP family intramembrane glutamic endopeptidase n=1 Tax=Candidatus Oscillochloris fontis TaxID=2496868 RepID=UPI00101DD0ED|nr:CPBP family intramembrane glutamic endopeptidase [Candidatus Oscillochloris fontis]
MDEPAPNLSIIGAAVLLLTLLLGAGLALGGEIGQIAGASLNTLPFAGLALLAYLGGPRFNWAWVATGLWLTLLIIGTATITLGLGIAVAANLSLVGVPADLPPLAPSAWLQIALLLLLAAAALLFSLVPLISPVRHWLARLLPLDPHSFVHTVALVAVLSITTLSIIPLLVLGAPPLLTLLSQNVVAASGGRDPAGMLRDQIYSLVWTIPAALVAVGYATRRSFTAALDRLGLVWPTWRQVLGAVLLALGLVALVQVLGLGIEWLWNQMGWPLTDQAAFDELLAFAISPIGAIVIGVSAGLGEELGVRGALQPRLGILLSNLFFTSLHALQYSWDALLIVFLVGMVCGFVRKQTNTTTSAIVHGVYNFTLVMLALWTGEI